MGSWYINKIMIDSRERVRGYNAYNYYIDTYEVGVESLKYGDYLFFTNDDKKVIFEFKTCKDFVKSMEDKSLFRELSNQSIHYKYSYLIICGDFNDIYEDLYFNVPFYRYKYKTLKFMKSRLSKQIEGALARIYVMYIPIIFVDNEEEAFDKMLKISSKVADEKRYGGIVRPVPKKLLDDPAAFFLTGIDGIGEKKSQKIIKELNIECLDDLCNRSISDFQSVKNVTNANVSEIWKRIHNETIGLF